QPHLGTRVDAPHSRGARSPRPLARPHRILCVTARSMLRAASPTRGSRNSSNTSTAHADADALTLRRGVGLGVVGPWFGLTAKTRAHFPDGAVAGPHDRAVDRLGEELRARGPALGRAQCPNVRDGREPED